jgi:hypothetical protein
MSKMTDKLLPEDFGRSFDEEVFGEWKQSINEHERTGTISVILLTAGLLAMCGLGGLISVGLFFVLGIIGIAQNAPKQSKRNKYQRQLGITGKDLQKAIAAAKERENSHSKN